MTATCQIVDLNSQRIRRAFKHAEESQGKLAASLRRDAQDRFDLASALDQVQGAFARIADDFTVLLTRLEREKKFREACLEAAELGDLDEMIRRRDRLNGELDAIREENPCALFARRR